MLLIDDTIFLVWDRHACFAGIIIQKSVLTVRWLGLLVLRGHHSHVSALRHYRIRAFKQDAVRHVRSLLPDRSGFFISYHRSTACVLRKQS